MALHCEAKSGRVDVPRTHVYREDRVRMLGCAMIYHLRQTLGVLDDHAVFYPPRDVPFSLAVIELHLFLSTFSLKWAWFLTNRGHWSFQDSHTHPTGLQPVPSVWAGTRGM